ncbi:MAG: hypothetical protein K9G62_05075 [Alphaproteobacteria bacterium]|nr:hypothetical protein [Alphaproteobacteria bacterium]
MNDDEIVARYCKQAAHMACLSEIFWKYRDALPANPDWTPEHVRSLRLSNNTDPDFLEKAEEFDSIREDYGAALHETRERLPDGTIKLPALENIGPKESIFRIRIAKSAQKYGLELDVDPKTYWATPK